MLTLQRPGPVFVSDFQIGWKVTTSTAPTKFTREYLSSKSLYLQVHLFHLKNNLTLSMFNNIGRTSPVSMLSITGWMVVNPWLLGMPSPPWIVTPPSGTAPPTPRAPAPCKDNIVYLFIHTNPPVQVSRTIGSPGPRPSARTQMLPSPGSQLLVFEHFAAGTRKIAACRTLSPALRERRR